MCRRKHEADTCTLNTPGNALGLDTNFNTKGRKYIRRPRSRRHSSVAMFSDRDTGSSNNKRGQRRDIVTSRMIAARPDNIHGIRRSIHPQHLGPHGLHGARNLVNCLATNPQPHQKGTDLRWCRLS